MLNFKGDAYEEPSKGSLACSADSINGAAKCVLREQLPTNKVKHGKTISVDNGLSVVNTYTANVAVD
jgi:hypothetical protein